MSADESVGITPAPAPAPSPPPAPEFRSRLREGERTTRKRLAWWDRVKLITLFLTGWGVLLLVNWAQFDPKITFADSVNQTLRGGGWLLALAGLELIRQVHYFICEHSAGYYRFWTRGVFGRLARRSARMNDWNRFRVARALKVVFWLVILDFALAKIFSVSARNALIVLPAKLVGALPFIFQIGFSFFFIIFQFIGLFWFLSRGGVDTYFPDDIEKRFTDVRGQDAALERVKENIIFLENPESIEERGGYVPGGILLWGPPGTGKTLMAEAVAGETGKPFVFVDPGAFINMFMGVGILKVKGLYRKLRKLALRYGGVIVFFDEADSLGNRGSLGTSGGWNFGTATSPWSTELSCNGMGYLDPQTRDMLFQASLASANPVDAGPRKNAIIAGFGGMGAGGGGTLQALLSEMSGLKKPRGFFNRILRRALGMRPKAPPKYRILHIFATNMPQSLDEAMLRPGRIDRIYKVGYPSKEGRKATYQYYLERVKHELTDQDVDRLATITPYATGATIQDMVNEGLVIAIRDGRDSITWKDIVKSKQLKEHGLPDDAEYVKRERHAVAIHEACHAVVAYRTRRHMVIDMATIERRGDIGGFVSSIPPEDQFVQWRSEREADVMTSLASLAGERMFFDGDNSAGVGGDMRSATAVVTLMEGYWAMGETVASHGVTKFGITQGRGSVAAEDGQDRMLLETELGRRVERKLQEMLIRTRALLDENRHEVLAVAHALETHRTVSGDDVVAVIEGTPGPIIDGRPYRSPAFRELAEEYHRQAIEAHRGHSHVEASLPVLATAPAGTGLSWKGDGGNGDGPGRSVGGNGSRATESEPEPEPTV